MALVAPPASAEIVERVVVKVNGDIITQSEFAARQLAAVQGARVGPDAVSAYLRDNNARLLQEAIDDLLLVQRARELGMRMRPEYINQVIEDIKTENNITSDEQLQRQLRGEGMTLGDLKRNIERSILRRQVLSQELESRFKVSEADARSEYERLKATEFHEPASVTLQEIALSDADARARAAEVIARVRAGEDFQALARELSTAPTAAAGGDLGRVVLADVSSALREAVASLPEGGLSEPVPLGDGYRVFRVVSRSPARTRSFDEVKAELLERLRRERTTTEYQNYVQGLRKDAVIETRVREVALDVEGGTGIVPTFLGSDPLPSPAEPAPSPTPLPAPSPAAGAAPAVAAPVAPVEADELSVSPQRQPQHVVPPAAPLPAPAPTPSPTPTPTPDGGARG